MGVGGCYTTELLNIRSLHVVCSEAGACLPPAGERAEVQKGNSSTGFKGVKDVNVNKTNSEFLFSRFLVVVTFL